MARKKLSSVSTSIPSPVGGWNSRDSLAAMPPTDAVSLVNYFPLTSDVVIRGGHTRHATGFPDLVETIIAYSGSTTDKLFGISNGSVYDATSGGAIGASVLSGLTNDRWQYVNIATPGGNFIEMCNGLDDVRNFDGTTWATPVITGVTSSNLANINLHKNRLWFCEAGSLKAWYLPVQSIAGAANALDLSSFCRRGGYLMAMATWTIDAGYGVDDLAVFITNKGEVLVYRGTDPSSVATWALVGVFEVGTPIGRRCFTKYKGDLLLITQDGLVSAASYLQSSRLDPKVSLTDKIQYSMTQAVAGNGNNFGWQVLPFPKQNMLILNVPYGESGNQQQFVMNTITGAWANFQAWQASCWEIYQDNPYFGSNGFIAQAWDTNSDNGDDIDADGLQAFNYFGSPGQLKRFVMMRPILLTNGTPIILGNVNIDYDDTAPTATLAVTPTTYAIWDSSLWDGLTSLWGAALSVTKNWQSVNGIGYCGAPRLKSANNGLEVHWVGTDLIMEPGGML